MLPRGRPKVAHFPRLNTQVSKGAPIWKAYVEFINDILIDGLARTVANSLKYLNDQMDPAQIAINETAPLLEVQQHVESAIFRAA